jgi:uncharacterized membrane protein
MEGDHKMDHNKETRILFQTGIIAAFSTLAFIGTMIIRIPIPVTGGYFNLGDTFVMAAALLYGPLAGLFVGAIGPAAADAVGFPQFILATAIVKGLEGLMVGLIGWKSKYSRWRRIAALVVGVAILVSGYYIFEAVVYPFIAQTIPFFAVTDAKAALAEIPPNLLQGILSAIVAYGIYKVLNRKD